MSANGELGPISVDLNHFMTSLNIELDPTSTGPKTN
jgi:hypothetical protein